MFKSGREGHFMKEWSKILQRNANQGNKAWSSSVSPQAESYLEEHILGTCIGENRLYVITSLKEQEILTDVVTGMIKVLTYDVYAFLDP